MIKRKYIRFKLTVLILIVCMETLNGFDNDTIKARSSLYLGQTVVNKSESFPYIAAILKKSSFLSTGVLITSSWVLSCADALYKEHQNPRIIRVRLGSTNYKKDGILRPIRSCEIHPFFDNINPGFDMALLMLSEPVKNTASISPIKMLMKQLEGKIDSLKYFDVPAWYVGSSEEPEYGHEVHTEDELRRMRTLRYAQIRPLKSKNCENFLDTWPFNHRKKFMCLIQDPLSSNPCMRRTGAPVVKNGSLWGVISSWTPKDCWTTNGPMLVNLVSCPYISDWILRTTAGHQWNMMINYQETDAASEIEDEFAFNDLNNI